MKKKRNILKVNFVGTNFAMRVQNDANFLFDMFTRKAKSDS